MITIQDDVAAARREIAALEAEAKEAEERAAQKRSLAQTAGPGPDADAWALQAEFFDRAADAQRRRIVARERWIQQVGAPASSFRV